MRFVPLASSRTKGADHPSNKVGTSYLDAFLETHTPAEALSMLAATSLEPEKLAYLNTATCCRQFYNGRSKVSLTKLVAEFNSTLLREWESFEDQTPEVVTELLQMIEDIDQAHKVTSDAETRLRAINQLSSNQLFNRISSLILTYYPLIEMQFASVLGDTARTATKQMPRLSAKDERRVWIKDNGLLLTTAQALTFKSVCPDEVPVWLVAYAAASCSVDQYHDLMSSVLADESKSEMVSSMKSIHTGLIGLAWGGCVHDMSNAPLTDVANSVTEAMIAKRASKTHQLLSGGIKSRAPYSKAERARKYQHMLERVTECLCSPEGNTTNVLELALTGVLSPSPYFYGIAPKEQFGGDRELPVLHFITTLCNHTEERRDAAVPKAAVLDSLSTPDEEFSKSQEFIDMSVHAVSGLSSVIHGLLDQSEWGPRLQPSLLSAFTSVFEKVWGKGPEFIMTSSRQNSKKSHCPS